MATLFEARQRFAISRSPATSARIAASISRSLVRAYTALNGTPHTEAPLAFAPEATSPTSALWILHAR